jgi:hypothetical protein
MASELAAVQPGLTEALRKAYAKQFQAAPPEGGWPRWLSFGRCSTQEMRMTASTDIRKFRSFLESSQSFRALA